MGAQPRLGVLGGSFNPPHVGHLVLASVACGQLGLERVLFVPAASPPHKAIADEVSASVRLEMTEAATEEDIRFVPSAIEIEEGLRFTCDLLAAIAARYPRHDLFFLMGSDSLLQFEHWVSPGGILARARLGVGLRPGCDADMVAAAARLPGGAVTLLDMPAVGISSSDIRRRVAAGAPIRYLVPWSVEDVIVRRRLYGSS